MSGLKRLFSWREPIGRRDYVVAGALLMALKFALDWSVARFGFGYAWTPGHYLLWPDLSSAGGSRVHALGQPFPLTLFAVALPFIWAGIALTSRRLRAANRSTGWALLFFVPWLNLVLFSVLAVVPSVSTAPVRFEGDDDPRFVRARRLAAQLEEAATRRWVSASKAIAAGSVAATLLVLLGTAALATYGYSLFIGAPFVLGFVVTFVHTRDAERSWGECYGMTLLALLFTAGTLLLFALEGVVCLAMAFPLAAVVALVGSLFGRGFEPAPGRARCAALLVAAPLLTWIEALQSAEPPLRVVTTEIVVEAGADAVWRHVVSFPPLPEPDDWLFRAGIAWPMRAEIEGEGVGAVRRCVFSTGTFVEPIDVWQPPNVLRFQVTEQPEPMREWSPWTIHPPHLRGFLESRQGEFRLVPLGPDRTRLEGTTWYVNRMAPAAYWGLWSDRIIHQIHRRVLDHVAHLAEL